MRNFCMQFDLRESGCAAGGGDSGGPWYNQTNRPVGIHKGGSSTFSVYSKLAYLPSGVTIWRG